jgi:hypothetical protein
VTSSTDSFFDDSVRSGAPSIKLSDVNDGVIGTIVDQFMVEKKKFASDEIEKDTKTGEPIQQLVVIVQTELKNWDRVAKVPLVDHNDKSKGEKPASEDDGKRAIYIAPYTNIHSAVGKATAVHNGGRPTGLANGATFGLKITALEDVGKGNPKRVFAAHYQPPAAGSEFFGESKSQGGPNDAAAPAQSGGTTPADLGQQQQDPWGTASTTGGPATERHDEPPF